MSTYNDLKIGNDWVDVFTTLGITVGKKSLILQNKGSTPLTLSLTASAPSGIEGIYLSVNERIIIPLGVQGLFVRANGAADTSSRLAIEDAGVIQTSSSLPADLFTADIYGVRRLAVDSQQTSFEANQQFRYVDRFEEIPATNNILYKFTTTVPINLLERRINLYTGGRAYYSYVFTNDSERTGGALSIFQRSPEPINHLLRDGLTVHPASNCTIERYDNVTSFTPATANGEDDFLDIDFIVTDGNVNRATSAYTSEGVRYGTGEASVSNPVSFWLWLPNISPTNVVSNGFIRLVWEERTNLS